MTLKVLFLIFPSVNTLDVNGPLEVLCNWAIRSDPKGNVTPPPYKIYIAGQSKTPATAAWEFVHIAPDLTFVEATRMINDNEIDVLIVPGFAPSNIGPDLIKQKDILEPMKAFLNPTKPFGEGKERWFISICVGAVLANAVGAFNGRKATTHFGLVPYLQVGTKKSDKSADEKPEWVFSRWVDGGVTDQNVRILSSGGISCGIDAMLYFVSQTLPKDNPSFETTENYFGKVQPKGAQKIAYMMDYEWNGGPADVLPTTKQLPGASDYDGKD